MRNVGVTATVAATVQALGTSEVEPLVMTCSLCEARLTFTVATHSPSCGPDCGLLHLRAECPNQQHHGDMVVYDTEKGEAR